MSKAPRGPIDWSGYLAQFHESRPGILEDVFSRATSGGATPYRWLTRVVSARAKVVLDLSCGSGRLGRELDADDRTIIGVDRSMSELRVAFERGAEADAADGFAETSIGRQGSWVCGSPLKLPLASESVDVVVSVMSFSIVRPLPVLMSEVSRVLRPGGMLAVLAPTNRPMAMRDLKMMARMYGHLRGKPRLPKRSQDTDRRYSLTKLVTDAGLRKLESKRELYRYPVYERRDAERFVHSLYLPKVKSHRVEATIDWLDKQAAKSGSVELPMPMRRFAAVK
ncbi:class I SAM-dependent methyltransferase [Enemella sp. A6]|uniref:class I SAM-dependent methyltransferase n=1 Tax=Enemella sp. A6 TaxID=3440152 RepID=UPI003EB90B96